MCTPAPRPTPRTCPPSPLSRRRAHGDRLNRLSGKTHTIAAGGGPWRPSTGDRPSSAPLVTQKRLSRRPTSTPRPLPPSASPLPFTRSPLDLHVDLPPTGCCSASRVSSPARGGAPCLPSPPASASPPSSRPAALSHGTATLLRRHTPSEALLSPTHVSTPTTRPRHVPRHVHDTSTTRPRHLNDGRVHRQSRGVQHEPVRRYSDAPVVGLATIAGSAAVGAASLPVALAGIWTAAPLSRSPEIAPRSPEIDRA